MTEEGPRISFALPHTRTIAPIVGVARQRHGKLPVRSANELYNGGRAMSPSMRALLIGMLGPVLQAVGVTWDLFDHGVFDHSGLEHITMAHIVTGPAHLMMFTGFLVSVVCIPLALQVAAARPEELVRPAGGGTDATPASELTTAEGTE